MTLSEIVEIVAEETGAPRDVVWGFVRSFMDALVDEIDRGNEVKVQGLGTFKWVDVPGKKLPSWKLKHIGHIVYATPPGKKLKFLPSKKFRTRRVEMSDDEGMTKYGVVLDDQKEKTASDDKGEVRICPVCGEDLDNAGACPEHGTQPLEPDSQ